MSASRVPTLSLSLALLGCTAPPSSAAASVPQEEGPAPITIGEHVFHRRLLSNGLRAAAVREETPEGEAATFSLFLAVDAGRRHEDPQTTGLAHLVEHALFTGTAAVGDDVLEKTVKGWGGEANAFTRDDYTLYYDHRVPLEHLERVLAMEADRLRGLTFDEVAFLDERERLRVEEQHTYQAAEGRDEELEAAVYRAHPYRAGLRDERGHTRAVALGLEPVRAFYERHYHPNRVALVVVSPLEHGEVLDAVEAAFGHLPAGPPAPPPILEPAVEEPRNVRLASTLHRDRTELVWLVPERAHPDRIPLAVLAGWLDRAQLPDGETVDASLDGRLEQGLLRVAAAGERRALERLIEGARAQAPPAEEVAAVKGTLVDRFDALDLRGRPYFSLASTFAAFDAVGQAELLARHAAAVAAVTPADVLAVAQHYLDPGRSVCVVFEGTGARLTELPDDPKELLAAAADAADAGDRGRAISAYTKLLELGPNRMNTVIYLASRGQVHLDGKDYDAAIADFAAALEVVEYPAVRQLLEEAEERRRTAQGTPGR